jgi:membrane-bound inhibitor of C-type lysozyme
MEKMLSIGVALVSAALLSGCATQNAVQQAVEEPIGAGRMQFACGNGEMVEMQFVPERDHGVLRRSGWSVELPRRAVDSGYAYSNGPTTVRGKGNEITIQIAHLAPIWCRGRSMLVAAR